MLNRLLWLRHETKAHEQRVALTPEHAKALIEQGHTVIVEKSPNRVFQDSYYAQMGCELVPANSWKTNAPEDATILGLKELEEEDFPLKHRHIFFAHAYKGQDGAEAILNRFKKGGGKLFDLEYLTNSDGRRVAAFGQWAGFAGAALGVDIWAHQQVGIDYNKAVKLEPFSHSDKMIAHVGKSLRMAETAPRTLIIGAKGRCGTGAKWLLEALGLEADLWGSQDTKDKGPIRDILDYDLMINTALMTKESLPWITPECLKVNRRLKTISDVSCDPTGPCNPLPIYNQITTMDEPVRKLEGNLSLTAIDHLPSLLPKESSQDFSAQLFPHLEKYMAGEIEGSSWERSLEVFYKLTLEAQPQGIQSAPEITL